MQDRVPLYPGRVTLTPVSGNTYDMAMADQPQVVGTPLNKATFLKDATAALFELTSAAVPDDVFAWIGKQLLRAGLQASLRILGLRSAITMRLLRDTGR